MMRKVYESGDMYAYLNPEAQRLLSEARGAYVRLGLDTGSVVTDGGDAVLFLCRGDRILNTAAVMLMARDLPIDVWGPAITVRKHSTGDVIRSLRAICSDPLPVGQQLAATVKNKQSEKYDWVLDETLLCVDYAGRDLSVNETIDALRVISDPRTASGLR
jgi:hypothetical protein